MVLLELGLDEKKLYKISKKEYLDNHPELKQEKVQVQEKRYEHYEKRRQEAINQARKIRTEVIEKEKKEGEDKGRNTKFSSTGFKNTKSDEFNKNDAQQRTDN